MYARTIINTAASHLNINPITEIIVDIIQMAINISSISLLLYYHVRHGLHCPKITPHQTGSLVDVP